MVESLRCVSVMSSMWSLCCCMYCVSCNGLVTDFIFCTFHCPILSVFACGSLVWCALASLLGLASFEDSCGCRILEASCARLGVSVGLLKGALELGRGTVWLRKCLVACLRVA